MHDCHRKLTKCFYILFHNDGFLLPLCFAAGQAREREKAEGASESQADDCHSASTDFTIQERVVLSQSLLAPQFEFQSQLQLRCCTSSSAGGPEKVCRCSTENDS